MLLEWMVSNALTASVLAAAALWVGYRFPRRPALAHACWLLVLVKLITPPIYTFTVINITVQAKGEASAPAVTETVALPPPAQPPAGVASNLPPKEAALVADWELQELLEWYDATWGLQNGFVTVPDAA